MIEVVDGAYVAPMSGLRTTGKGGTFDGGVYYSDRSICALAEHAKQNYRNIPSPIQELGKVPFISGTHLYCGMLQNSHFGHFLTESLGRLWAGPIVADNLVSIVFFPRVPGNAVPAFIHDTLRLLGLKATITLVNELTQFERLLVPNQLMTYGPMVGGHSLFRKFTGVLRDAPRTIDAPVADKIYVSRSKLNRHLGHLLLEEVIEENLVREGYSIIHPEGLNVADQLSY